MTTSTKTAALLIDGDNAQLKYTEQIIQFCKNQGYGTLKIINAYGDWKKQPLSSHGKKLTELDLSINLVQQDRVGSNATDFRLAMEVAVMLHKKEADVYIIVSSDADFTAMCQWIGQNGAEVYGIGDKGKNSSKMRKFCNGFFSVEKIVKKQDKLAAKAAAKSKTKTSTETAKKQSKAANVPKAKTAAETSPKQSEPTTKATAPKTKPKTAVETAQKQTKAVNKASPKAKSEVTSQAAAVPKPKSSTPAETAPKQRKQAAKSPPAPNPSEATGKKQNKAVAASQPKTILEILIQAYEATPQKDADRWVYLPLLKEKIGKEFAERFKGKKLSTWLRGFPDTFEIEDDRVRMK
jgi:uncharacterized LabA/DUF88 family protein